MKSLFSNLSMVALIICLSVNYASSLRCYECGMSLQDDPACDETYSLSSNMIKDCPESNDSVCLKGELLTGDGIYLKTVRKCKTLEPGDKKYFDETGKLKDSFSFMGISANIYICYTDLCNGTRGVMPSTIMILFISAVLSIYFSILTK